MRGVSIQDDVIMVRPVSLKNNVTRASQKMALKRKELKPQSDPIFK